MMCPKTLLAGAAIMTIVVMVWMPDDPAAALAKLDGMSDDELRAFLDADEDLELVRLDPFSRHVKGVAMSPQALESAKRAHLEYRKTNQKSEFRATLWAGYTPHHMIGQVVFEDGQPAAGIGIQLKVLHYVRPPGFAEYDNLVEINNFSMFTDENGRFAFKNIPTGTAHDVRIMVHEPHPHKTGYVGPVSRDNLVITIDRTRLQTKPKPATRRRISSRRVLG